MSGQLRYKSALDKTAIKNAEKRRPHHHNKPTAISSTGTIESAAPPLLASELAEDALYCDAAA